MLAKGTGMATTDAPATSKKRKSALPKLIDKYYADLKDLAHQNVLYEMGTRPAFHALLAAAGKEHGWTLIAEHEKKVNGKSIRPDGTFKDGMNLVRGYWEAKDTDDDLEKETLAGIPAETYAYRLGNRSALEWVIDQYQVYTDPRSNITSDPNREDDPQYITRLVGQVIRVSIDTMKIVRSLPTDYTVNIPK